MPPLDQTSLVPDLESFLHQLFGGGLGAEDLQALALGLHQDDAINNILAITTPTTPATPFSVFALGTAAEIAVAWQYVRLVGNQPYMIEVRRGTQADMSDAVSLGEFAGFFMVDDDNHRKWPASTTRYYQVRAVTRSNQTTYFSAWAPTTAVAGTTLAAGSSNADLQTRMDQFARNVQNLHLYPQIIVGAGTLRYTFSSTLNLLGTNPGPGVVQFNSASWNLVTLITMHSLERSGLDAYKELDAYFQPGMIMQAIDEITSERATYSITAVSLEGEGVGLYWYVLTVVAYSLGVVPPNGALVGLRTAAFNQGNLLSVLSVKDAALSVRIDTQSQSISVLSQQVSALSQAHSVLSQAVSVLSQAASVAQAALSVRIDTQSQAISVLSQGVSIVSTAASNALSVANAASNAASVVSQAVSVVSVAAANALSVANAASNAASVVSQAVSVLSQAVSVAQAALSVRIDTQSQSISVLSQRISGLSVITGNLRISGVVSVEGGQIAFPAIQVPSAGANVLDDYEEGSWTPVLTCDTPGNLTVVYANQAGRYTRIGRLVVVACYLNTSTFTHTTASGPVRITGLPFAVSGGSVGLFIGNLYWSGITKANYTHVNAYADGGTSQLTLGAFGSGQGATYVAIADLPTGGSVTLNASVAYEA